MQPHELGGRGGLVDGVAGRQVSLNLERRSLRRQPLLLGLILLTLLLDQGEGEGEG